MRCVRKIRFSAVAILFLCWGICGTAPTFLSAAETSESISIQSDADIFFRYGQDTSEQEISLSTSLQWGAWELKAAAGSAVPGTLEFSAVRSVDAGSAGIGEALLKGLPSLMENPFYRGAAGKYFSPLGIGSRPAAVHLPSLFGFESLSPSPGSPILRETAVWLQLKDILKDHLSRVGITELTAAAVLLPAGFQEGNRWRTGLFMEGRGNEDTLQLGIFRHGTVPKPDMLTADEEGGENSSWYPDLYPGREVSDDGLMGGVLYTKTHRGVSFAVNGIISLDAGQAAGAAAASAVTYREGPLQAEYSRAAVTTAYPVLAGEYRSPLQLRQAGSLRLNPVSWADLRLEITEAVNTVYSTEHPRWIGERTIESSACITPGNGRLKAADRHTIRYLQDNHLEVYDRIAFTAGQKTETVELEWSAVLKAENRQFFPVSLGVTLVFFIEGMELELTYSREGDTAAVSIEAQAEFGFWMFSFSAETESGVSISAGLSREILSDSSF